MTEPIRTKLVDAAINEMSDAGKACSHGEVAEAIVDAILDELMEPGDGAHEVADHWMVEDWGTYRNILTTIKAGK